MGESIRIQDLARQMIRLAGLTPDEDIKIEFTGLRAGEKMYEELTYNHEKLTRSAREGIRVATGTDVDAERLHAGLKKLIDQAMAGDPERTRAMLHDLVPDYHAPDDDVTPPRAAAGD